MELTTVTEVVRLKDEEGNVLLEAPLIELHHFCVLTLIDAQDSGENLSYVELAKLQAEKVNQEFKSQITWGQMVQITEYMNEKIEELKKKNSSTVAESPSSTASTP